MSSQDLLNGLVLDTLQDIGDMREKLERVRNGSVEPNLQMLKNLQARKNGEKLKEKLDIVSAVSQTQITLQLLLASSDFTGALDLIAATHDILQVSLQLPRSCE